MAAPHSRPAVILARPIGASALTLSVWGHGCSCTLPGVLRIAGRHGDVKNYKGWRTVHGSRGDVPVQEATEPADVEGSLTVAVTDRPRPEDVR